MSEGICVQPAEGRSGGYPFGGSGFGLGSLGLDPLSGFVPAVSLDLVGADGIDTRLNIVGPSENIGSSGVSLIRENFTVRLRLGLRSNTALRWGSSLSCWVN